MCKCCEKIYDYYLKIYFKIFIFKCYDFTANRMTCCTNITLQKNISLIFPKNPLSFLVQRLVILRLQGSGGGGGLVIVRLQGVSFIFSDFPPLIIQTSRRVQGDIDRDIQHIIWDNIRGGETHIIFLKLQFTHASVRACVRVCMRVCVCVCVCVCI